MATTTSKKKEAPAEEIAETNGVPEVEKPLEELILNKTHGKYQAVELIAFHAKFLRTQEDLRHLTPTELLELAMREVLSGKVDEAELMKKMLAAPPVKKDAEKNLKKKN